MTQKLLLEIDQDIFSLNSQRKDFDTLIRRKLGLSGPGMKGPGVPRANDAVALDPSLPQRPMTMRAPVIESGELSADVRKTDGNAFHLSLGDVSRCGSLGETAQLDPLCHFSSSASFMLLGPGARRGMLKS